ncbi:hypothetical protein RC62_4353 [Flavobacterium aquidurense]|uniref:Uncharacterized protein n=1 Tax=Flavobacterium aquidurense TaxID=362413 RepID=A0A0Q0RV68_9FLAO|nr:hypothetical protein RC62_4353 [Flavobacterium aquidurense]
MVINLTVCAVAVLFGGFDYFFITILSFGFLMSIAFKELYRQNDYLFYSNNGISKIHLLVFAYAFTFFTTILIGFITFVIKNVF